jgi:ankyrin repeat protein
MSQNQQLRRWLVVLSLAVGIASRGTGPERLLAAEPESENKKEEKDVLQPQLKQATLQVGRQLLKPTRIGPPSQREYQTRNRHIVISTYTANGPETEIVPLPDSPRHIVIDKDTVTAHTSRKGKPDWVARSPDKHHLQWLADDDATGYLLGYIPDAEGKFQRYTYPLQVRRLDLKSGRWLTNLKVGSADRKAQQTDTILRVLLGDGYFVVLSRRVKSRKDWESTVVGYEVTCFCRGKDKPEWVKALPSAGARSAPGVYLFGGHPAYASSSLQHLSWMGDSLLVCPEAVQPIICLDRDTGSEAWKLERPWEYDRGFIGPSVWSHYMARFRMSSWDQEPGKIAAARKKFDQEHVCAIIAGPVVMPLPFKRDTDTHSIFVAVAKGPATALSGYISDCIVYEFNDHGKPVSMAKLPYTLSGSQYVVQQDGVVWKCQNEAFIRLAPTEHASSMTCGFGGADLTSISWMRRLARVQRHGWLTAGQASDPIVFGKTHAFCLPSGGYVARQDDSVYHFPLSGIDLQTGDEQRCLLHVPFKGKVPVPKMNYSSRSSGGGSTVHASGPYLLGITQLHLEENTLEITLGTAKTSSSLFFDLGKADSLRKSVETDSEQEDLKAWVKSLGNVNKRDEDGRTPLHNASDDVDPKYVKALLAAGADVKAKTSKGWTPLMYAAYGGTAEVVQLLIDAGSDVNARLDRDAKHFGGSSVLMLAAWGTREGKKKVQALIKAGANPKATADDGWTVLMSATESQLPTVEFLLKAGLDVNAKTKNGRTALMLAAGYAPAYCDNATLVSVLLKASAKIEARNHEGRTPLMYAAERGSVTVLEVLLQAGADVHAKDKNGKTALDLARKAGYGETEERVKILEAAMKGKKRAEKHRAEPVVEPRTSSNLIEELPQEDRTLDSEQLKRLRVSWEKPRRKIDDKGRRLEITGKLSMLQPDGKTLRPVDWPYPIRVVITRRPSEKPDWSRFHDERDSLWEDTLVGRTIDSEELPAGVFIANFDLGEIESPIGATKPFQVGLSFGEKNGNRVLWCNVAPILPQSVKMLDVSGPKFLSRTLQLINACPTPAGPVYDPIALVRATNHLQSLGKDRAIAQLREFLEHSSRTGHTRGRIDPRNIDTSNQWCLASLVPLLFEGMEPDAYFSVWRGIPFNTFFISEWKGSPGSTRPLVDRAAKGAKLWARPLRPADNPLEAADSLYLKMVQAKVRWPRWDLREHLRGQAWQAIRHLVDTGEESSPDFLSEETWNDLKARVKRLKIRWDEERQKYVAGEKGK